MTHRRRWLAAALLAAAAAAGAAAQTPHIIARPVDSDEVPPADLLRLDEPALRAIVSERWRPDAARDRAGAELLRRFPSDAATAFVLNAQARALDDRLQGQAAFDLYMRVRARFAGHADPAVEREVARAIQGQAQALDTIEAAADTGPLRPLTAETTDLNSPSDRMRRELVDLFADRRDPEIRLIVLQERYNLTIGELIAGIARPRALRALIREYEGLAGVEPQRQIAEILRSIAHFEHDPRRQILAHEELIRRFRASQDERLRQHVDESYGWMELRLEELGRTEAAARARADHEAFLGYPLPPRPDRPRG